MKSFSHSVSLDSLDYFDYKSSDMGFLDVKLSDNHDDKFINIQSNKINENENNKSKANQQFAYQNPKTSILHDSTKSLFSLGDDSLKEKIISKEFSLTSKFSKEDNDFIKKEVLLRAIPNGYEIGKSINKSPRSCRDRYFIYLSDRILSPIWSIEDDVLLKLYTSIGPRWLSIYKWFPNHSPSYILDALTSVQIMKLLNIKQKKFSIITILIIRLILSSLFMRKNSLKMNQNIIKKSFLKICQSLQLTVINSLLMMTFLQTRLIILHRSPHLLMLMFKILICLPQSVIQLLILSKLRIQMECIRSISILFLTRTHIIFLLLSVLILNIKSKI